MSWRSSLIAVDKNTYITQWLKGVVILITLINVLTFAFFVVTESHRLPTNATSISLWYQFFVIFILAFVSIFAFRAVTERKPSMLLLFIRCNLFFAFSSFVILAILMFGKLQVAEYLLRDLCRNCRQTLTRSVVEMKLQQLIHCLIVKIGWEILSAIVAHHYYKKTEAKPIVSVIYTIPEQYITCHSEIIDEKHKLFVKHVTDNSSNHNCKTNPYAKFV